MKNNHGSLLFRFSVAAVSSAALFLTGGCATHRTGEVYRDWTTSFSQLGIYPVFPPREDVVVGDVYLLPMHPLDGYVTGKLGGLGVCGMHLGYASWEGAGGPQRLAGALSDFYRNRPTFPATSQTNAAAPPDVPSLPGVADHRTNVFSGLEPVRLKEVAFPEFSFTTINEAAVAAMAPIHGVMASIGLDFSQVDAVAVKVPQAESYGLPVDRLLGKFLGAQLWRNEDGLFLRADGGSSMMAAPAGELARQMFTKSLLTAIENEYPWWKHPFTHWRLKSRVAEGRDSLYLALLDEVYYARAISFTLTSTRGFGAAASAAPVSPQVIGQWLGLGQTNPANVTNHTTNIVATVTNTPATGGTNFTVTIASAVSASGAAESQDPFAVAAKLRSMDIGATAPGGSLRILGVSAHSVTLERTFEHPIAVGVRGVLLQIAAQAESIDACPAGGRSTNRIPIQGYRVTIE